MSTEENKAVFRRFIEESNKGKEAGMAAMELCAADYVIHGTGVFPDTDRAGYKQRLTALWTAFPDAHLVVEDLIAEGDKVASRYTFRGTHQGEIMGIPPTGKRVSWTGIAISRIEDGKFVEDWFSSDDLGFLPQVGAIPQMAQGGA
jgi:steroid delta-isomerase-like uncharacterized protein